MKTRLQLDILRQPDDSTCGATCLNAVYRYFGDEIPLDRLIRDVEHLEEGGTLGVLLGKHALARGYDVRLYTYNLAVFDPTWFEFESGELIAKLNLQMKAKKGRKLKLASKAYIEFLEAGGKILFTDLTVSLIRRYLRKALPILAGLSATFLYRSRREYGPDSKYDDIRGFPVGHFVVLCGYDPQSKRVLVADPYLPNPVAKDHYYEVDIAHLISAILLGVLTYDANLIIIQPRGSRTA